MLLQRYIYLKSNEVEFKDKLRKITEGIIFSKKKDDIERGQKHIKKWFFQKTILKIKIREKLKLFKIVLSKEDVKNSERMKNSFL